MSPTNRSLKMVIEKIFDADFYVIMKTFGFKDSPREKFTINDILKFRKIEKYL